jgi:HEAT repeat protein
MLPGPLSRLQADLRSLLAGGAAAARAGCFRRWADELGALARQAPALGAAARAAGRLRDLAPDQVPPSLLDLLVAVRQVASALAAAAVQDGPAAAVERSGPWRTDTPAADLDTATAVLARRGPGRRKRLWAALARGSLADLRLLSPLYCCLRDLSGVLADFVAQEVLPQFGPGLLPDLVAGLNLRGDRGDARRLDVVCRLGPEAGRRLCLRALTEGSAPLRHQALALLAGAPAPGSERAILRLLAAARSAPLRRAALDALAPFATDEVLNALLAALGEDTVSGSWRDQYVWVGARVALRSLAHPHTGPQLRKELGRAVAEADSAPPPAEAASRPRGVYPAPPARRLARLVQTLGERKDEEALPGILPLVRHPAPEVRDAAVMALAKMEARTAEAIAALRAALGDEKETVAWKAIDALRDAGPAAVDAVPDLLALLGRPGSERDGRNAALRALEKIAWKTPEVAAAFVAALGDDTLAYQACESLRHIGPVARAALPGLIEVIRRRPKVGYSAATAVAAVCPDPEEAVAALAAALCDPEVPVRFFAVWALRIVGVRHPPVARALRPMLNDADDTVRKGAAEALAGVA